MILSKTRQNEIDQKINDLFIKTDKSYPENSIFEIVEALKIKLINISEINDPTLTDDVSAMIMKKDNQVIIGLRVDENNKRRNNFSLAHELGHYILHPIEEGTGNVKYRKDYFNYYNEDEKITREETEANYFAASLLVNKDKLEYFLSANLPISIIADYFSVSESVIRNRILWLNKNY